MVQTRIVVGVCAFLLGACASQQGKVSEQQMARVPSARMAEVDQARTDLSRAEDRLAKQDLAIESAEREISVANGDVRVAEAELQRTGSMTKKADFDRNAPGQRQSDQDASLFRAQKEAAVAHLTAATSASKWAKAQKQELEAERDVAKAQLASRKYDALVETGDPSIKETDANAVKKNLDESRSRVQAAKGAVATAKTIADRDQRLWETSKSAFESRRGTGGATTTR